jgi:PAS domain S-box-containing protein
MIYLPDAFHWSNSFIRSNQQPDSVLDYINCGFLAVDDKGILIACNAVARQMLGIEEEAIDTPIKSISQTAQLQDWINSDQDNHDKLLVCRDRTLTVHIVSGKDNQAGNGFLILLQDVTELEKIKAELKYCEKLNKELEDIITSSYDGILITDGEGNVLKINESLLRITELTREHFMGHKMESLYENGHFFSASVESLARKSKKIVSGIQKISTGKEVLVTSTPVFDDEGNVIRMVTNPRDMAEIKTMQDNNAQTR